jgi:hypothetical protein
VDTDAGGLSADSLRKSDAKGNAGKHTGGSWLALGLVWAGVLLSAAYVWM